MNTTLAQKDQLGRHYQSRVSHPLNHCKLWQGTHQPAPLAQHPLPGVRGTIKPRLSWPLNLLQPHPLQLWLIKSTAPVPWRLGPHRPPVLIQARIRAIGDPSLCLVTIGGTIATPTLRHQTQVYGQVLYGVLEKLSVKLAANLCPAV